MILKGGSTTDGWDYYYEFEGESSAAKKYFRVNSKTGETEYFDNDIEWIMAKHRRLLELLSK